MLVTDQGKMIRTTVGDIRVMGRNTQGVTIFRVADNEHVVSVAKIEESEKRRLSSKPGPKSRRSPMLSSVRASSTKPPIPKSRNRLGSSLKHLRRAAEAC